MFEKHSTRTSEARPTVGRLAWAGAFALAAVVLASGCENNDMGRTCDIKTDAGVSPTRGQGAYSTNAADCPSRLCIKPAVQAGVASDPKILDTGPYCTVECNSDSDCNGQTRDFGNPNDTRCRIGYTCAIPFDTGRLCCKKLCMCRDFLFPSSEAPGDITPDICKSDSANSCS
jgi:hypothetical protein